MEEVEVRSSTCATCGHDCAPADSSGGGMLHVIWKDLKGEWQQARYCKPCAKHNGDLQDERAQKAIEQAERSGV